MARFKGSSADVEDLLAAIGAIREDTGCHTRVLLLPAKGADALLVTAQSYRNDGAPIGIGNIVRPATIGGRALVDEVQLALHELYWTSLDKATGGSFKEGALRHKRR